MCVTPESKSVCLLKFLTTNTDINVHESCQVLNVGE